MFVEVYPEMKRFISSPAVFVVLSFLYPAAFLFLNNHQLYTSAQIVCSFWFILFVSVFSAAVLWVFSYCFATISVFIVKKLCKVIDSKRLRQRIIRAVTAGLGSTLLLVLLQVPIFSILKNRTILLSLYIMVPLVVLIISFFFSIRILNMMVLCLILFNFCFFGIEIIQRKTINPAPALVKHDVPKSLIFKHKPNVYLVVLESYNSLDVRRDVYGIDNKVLTSELIEQGFTIYDNVFSNYVPTLPSVASIFMMDHHYYKKETSMNQISWFRKIIGGQIDNPVLEIFKNNGYEIDFNLFNNTLYHAGSLLANYQPQPLLQPLEVFQGVFIGVVKVFKRDLWESKVFQFILKFPDKLFLKHGEEIEKTGKGNNSFVVIYTGAQHTPSDLDGYPALIQNLPNAYSTPLWRLNRENNYWITTYKNAIARSDQTLINLIRELKRKDPGALVVLIGDHGAFFYRNCWMGKNADLNRNIEENGIAPAEVTRDIFKVFLAIKWPGQKPEGLFSHVNLFRAVFAAVNSTSKCND